MDALLKAIELNRFLVLASEDWAKGFSKAPEQHAKLLKVDARLNRKIMQYFKDLANNTHKFINWGAYRYAVYEINASKVNAYDVTTIVNDNALDASDNTFISVVFEEIAAATALGAQSGETIYNVPLGITPTDADIQRIAHQHVANLVGKSWDVELGKYIDNPNSDYQVSNKTRADIRASIQTSINLGEDIQTATKRLQSTIKNAKRAEMIANTETVNSYSAGLLHFGTASNAVGKEWEDNGATDECSDYAQLGAVPFDYSYDGLDGPTAHPNCRCHLRLIYQNELDDTPDLFGDNA